MSILLISFNSKIVEFYLVTPKKVLFTFVNLISPVLGSIEKYSVWVASIGISLRLVELPLLLTVSLRPWCLALSGKYVDTADVELFAKKPMSGRPTTSEYVSWSLSSASCAVTWWRRTRLEAVLHWRDKPSRHPNKLMKLAYLPNYYYVKYA